MPTGGIGRPSGLRQLGDHPPGQPLGIRAHGQASRLHRRLGDIYEMMRDLIGRGNAAECSLDEKFGPDELGIPNAFVGGAEFLLDHKLRLAASSPD